MRGSLGIQLGRSGGQVADQRHLRDVARGAGLRGLLHKAEHGHPRIPVRGRGHVERVQETPRVWARGTEGVWDLARRAVDVVLAWSICLQRAPTDSDASEARSGERCCLTLCGHRKDRGRVGTWTRANPVFSNRLRSAAAPLCPVWRPETATAHALVPCPNLCSLSQLLVKVCGP